MVNNETLEKMKYLHSCRFTPDMIDCGHGMLVPYDPEEKIDYAVELPYFTESKLWELLGQPTVFWDNNTSMLEILLHKAIQSVNKGHLKAEEKQ